MTVDDSGGVLRRIKKKYPSVGAVKRPRGRPFVDSSSHDPEGNIFDIAEPGKKFPWKLRQLTMLNQEVVSVDLLDLLN